MFRTKLDKEIDRQMYVFLTSVPQQLHLISNLLSEIRDQNREVLDDRNVVETTNETAVPVKRGRGRPRKNPLMAA